MKLVQPEPVSQFRITINNPIARSPVRHNYYYYYYRDIGYLRARGAYPFRYLVAPHHR